MVSSPASTIDDGPTLSGATTPSEGGRSRKNSASGGEKEKRKKKFRKSWSGGAAKAGSGDSAGGREASMGSSGSGSGSEGMSATAIAVADSKKKVDYSLGTQNDIVGIVMLEIQGADDLPRLKNSEIVLFPSLH